MLNYLWGFMILAGIIIGALTGNIDAVGTEAISSAKEAVTLCITMLGVMSMWTGLMQVARAAGMIDGLTKALRPLLALLFPRIPKGHIVFEYISSNMIANFLGLGWAATPAGLKAMEEMGKINKKQNGAEKAHIASKEMCTFLIINISSLQLIPVNIIAYRSQYGSVNPASIVGTAMAATAFSTLAGVVFCKIMDGK